MPNSTGTDKNAKIQILLVDDDNLHLEVSKSILTDLESIFEITLACSAAEALTKMSQASYDIIISDYEMPQKDGLQFLKELRQQNNNIPFILFTGKGRETVAIRALNLGADGYHNKQGCPETVYGELAHSIKLVVEKNRAKKALQEEVARLTKLASQTPGLLYQFLRRPDGTYCVPYASEQIGSVFGFTPEDVKDDFSPIAKVIIPEDLQRVIQSIEYSAKHLSAWQCEYRVNLSGEIRWLWGQSVPEKLSDGSILWSGFNADITERKKAEESLAESEARYRNLYENMLDGALLSKPDGTILTANPKTCQMLGMTEEEIKKAGRDGIVVQNEQEAKALSESDREGYVRADITLRRKNGTTFVGELSSNTFLNATGVRVKSVIIRDITERKNAEEHLRSNQEQLKTIIENAPIGIATSDSNMRFLSSNNAFCKSLGYTEAQLKKLNYRDITCEEDVEVSNSYMKKLVNGEIPSFSQEKRYRRKDGTVFFGKITVSTVRNAQSKPMLFIAQLEDITEIKRAQTQLIDSDTRYRSLFQQAPLAVAITSLDGRIIDANRALENLIGLSLDELKKTRVESWYKTPKDRDTMLDLVKQKDVVDFATEFKLRDRCIDIVMNVSKFRIGQEIFLRTTIQDITERRKAEEAFNNVMDELVLVNEKLNVIGSMVRHDVRNKLSAITGYSYLLKKKHADNLDIIATVSKMEQAVRDCAEVFDFATMYEQLGLEKLTYVDLESTVNQTISHLSGCNLKLVNDCQGVDVLADSSLRQLLYNFVDNTIKHGQKATAIRVYYEQTANGELRLIYEDDGVGVPVENKRLVFAKGFSTGGSTGYGLYLIQKMMDIYSWKIEENGEFGQGAKFIITIPRKNKADQTAWRKNVKT